MPVNFLDIHVVDFCQLDCKHCYLKKADNFMSLDMIKSICEDFLQAEFPVPKSNIILSGGDPLLHPDFEEVCAIVRELNGFVCLSTNGILVPKYITTFKKNDGIQVSIDGNEEIHNSIRGNDNYKDAVKALKLLDEYGIKHGVGFTISQLNKHCIDHVIDLCIETGASTLNCNIYQPINYDFLQPVTFKEWLDIREYAAKRAEKEGIYLPNVCIEKGCCAGILGISVLTDGTYWDCSRNQQMIGKYPQKINDVLFWDNIKNVKPRDQFETCCRSLVYE
ncbi:MAG: heme d1 biosynthesis protein [Methanolobus sp.]|nr:heme d1 biosynthesis protein [Methanolobus sp.]